MEAIPRNQPPIQEPSKLLKTGTKFGDNRVITKKKDVFQETNKQLLNSKHTLTLGQLMHLALDLKQYVVSKMSPSCQLTHPQAPPSNVRSVVINPHMAIILVHVGKNLVEDVLLDGGLNVNIITKVLKKKLGLPFFKPTPDTLRMANQTLTKLIVLIQDLKLHIHGISYVVTFIAMKNNILDLVTPCCWVVHGYKMPRSCTIGNNLNKH